MLHQFMRVINHTNVKFAVQVLLRNLICNNIFHLTFSSHGNVIHPSFDANHRMAVDHILERLVQDASCELDSASRTCDNAD